MELDLSHTEYAAIAQLAVRLKRLHGDGQNRYFTFSSAEHESDVYGKGTCIIRGKKLRESYDTVRDLEEAVHDMFLKGAPSGEDAEEMMRFVKISRANFETLMSAGGIEGEEFNWLSPHPCPGIHHHDSFAGANKGIVQDTVDNMMRGMDYIEGKVIKRPALVPSPPMTTDEEIREMAGELRIDV